MENHDLIDKYFENSLSPKDQKLFNELLQSDSKFREEFEFQKDLKQVIEVSQKEELKKTVAKIEELSQQGDKLLMVPKKWLVAASFLLITGLATWGVKSTYFPSNDALYEEYFQPERNTVQPVVRGESLNTISYKAFVAYESKDYYKAINLFNSVEDPEDSQILFYKGMCFLAVDKMENAIELLKQVKSQSLFSGDSETLHEKATWFLALAYVKNNEKTLAIEQLNEIVEKETSGFKKKEAEEVLNYLQ